MNVARLEALGTSAAICVTDEDALAAALAVLRWELTEIDLACSRFRSDSELVRLNRSAGRPVRVGRRLLEAVQVALRAAETTGGLVDPTVGRGLRLVGYDRDFAEVRLRDGRGYRASFASAPGWQRVDVDARRMVVRIPHGSELDLGATAKGLAADRAARAAADLTGSGVLVSLGGDVATAGDPPLGGWPVRIADDHAAPLDARGPTVAVSSGGLATSGTCVRRWRMGATELHHVLDPRTGAPAETPWRTVSVAAGSCLDANTASTAAVILGAAAPSWLAERRLPARLVTVAGSSTCVAGWPEERR